jgi:hypothetical protein
MDLAQPEGQAAANGVQSAAGAPLRSITGSPSHQFVALSSVASVHRKRPAVDWPQWAIQSTCRLPAWRRSHSSAIFSGICSHSRRRRKRPRRWSKCCRRRSGASRRSAVLAEILTSLAATSSGQCQKPRWRSRGPCSRRRGAAAARRDNLTASTARSGPRPPQRPRFAGAWPEGGSPASPGGPACGG